MATHGSKIRLTAVLTACIAASACGPNSGDSPSDISTPEKSSFIALTGTTAFPDSGIEWESSREFLRHGEKQTDGSCRFITGAESGDVVRQYAVLEEIAANRDTCVSLVRAGIPTQAGWDKLRKALEAIGATNLGSKPAVINAEQPHADTTVIAPRAESSTPGEDFYTYSIQFTDGNNNFIGGFNGLLGLVGISPTSGINAGAVSTSVGYQYDPATTVDIDSCAPISQASLYHSNPRPGQAGWKVLSGGSCFAWQQTIAYRTITQYTGWDKDGNDLGTAAGKSLCEPYMPTDVYCRNLNRPGNFGGSIT